MYLIMYMHTIIVINFFAITEDLSRLKYVIMLEYVLTDIM